MNSAERIAKLVFERAAKELLESITKQGLEFIIEDLQASYILLYDGEKITATPLNLKDMQYSQEEVDKMRADDVDALSFSTGGIKARPDLVMFDMTAEDFLEKTRPTAKRWLLSPDWAERINKHSQAGRVNPGDKLGLYSDETGVGIRVLLAGSDMVGGPDGLAYIACDGSTGQPEETKGKHIRYFREGGGPYMYAADEVLWKGFDEFGHVVGYIIQEAGHEAKTLMDDQERPYTQHARGAEQPPETKGKMVRYMIKNPDGSKRVLEHPADGLSWHLYCDGPWICGYHIIDVEAPRDADEKSFVGVDQSADDGKTVIVKAEIVDGIMKIISIEELPEGFIPWFEGHSVPVSGEVVVFLADGTVMEKMPAHALNWESKGIPASRRIIAYRVV